MVARAVHRPLFAGSVLGTSDFGASPPLAIGVGNGKQPDLSAPIGISQVDDDEPGNFFGSLGSLFSLDGRLDVDANDHLDNQSGLDPLGWTGIPEQPMPFVCPDLCDAPPALGSEQLNLMQTSLALDYSGVPGGFHAASIADSLAPRSANEASIIMQVEATPFGEPTQLGVEAHPRPMLESHPQSALASAANAGATATWNDPWNQNQPIFRQPVSSCLVQNHPPVKHEQQLEHVPASPMQHVPSWPRPEVPQAGRFPPNTSLRTRLEALMQSQKQSAVMPVCVQQVYEPSVTSPKRARSINEQLADSTWLARAQPNSQILPATKIKGQKRPKASRNASKEHDYVCGYCRRVKTSSSSCSDGRVRIRCECGGQHQDGKPRMHATWSPVVSAPGTSESGQNPLRFQQPSEDVKPAKWSWIFVDDSVTTSHQDNHPSSKEVCNLSS